MISHFTEKENNIIACALEYWAWPTHRKELIEALKAWKWAMDMGGKETDPTDLAEGKETGKLIKKINKIFDKKKEKK